jgi:phage shock protein C
MDDRATNYHSSNLYRSDHSVFFGVCGGIAEHFDLPPWGVRFFFLLLSIFGFFPYLVILYIVLALVLKKRPPRYYQNNEERVFWGQCGGSRAEALRRINQRFQALDRRLQRMESIVTRPGFGLEDEYKNL